MTGLLIGYARVSTNDQALTAQKNALAALGVTPEQTFTGQSLTGANRARPGLRQALAACWARTRQGVQVAKANGRLRGK
ncbi:recombinase family protein [Arthrobacter sp. MDT3-24]